jgi:hypothetical protein
VSDGYWISKLGRPVVVVVQKVFEVAARTQAKLLGAADLPICSYPATPLGDDIEPVAALLAGNVISILGRPAEA